MFFFYFALIKLYEKIMSEAISELFEYEKLGEKDLVTKIGACLNHYTPKEMASLDTELQ